MINKKNSLKNLYLLKIAFSDAVMECFFELLEECVETFSRKIDYIDSSI
jgi:hypothetical protein